MALKRRILAPVRFVFPFDDAVDMEASDYAGYVAGHCDWTKLKLHEGKTPTVFVLRGLKLKQRVDLDNFGTAIGQAVYAVRCALVAVEGATVETPTGAALPEVKPAADGMLPESTLEALALTKDDLVVLGGVIRAISEVSDPLFSELGKALTAAA